MLVEVGELWCAEFPDVGGRREGVHLHREQLAPDEIALLRLSRPHRDVRDAHGQIHRLIVEDDLDADVRIEVQELADALRHPDRAEAHAPPSR